jgi:DNA-binding MarR family transcriptional regulator
VAPDGISEREWALWRGVALMGRRLSAALERAVQDAAGISSAEFEVLNALSHSPDQQARARDLADMLSWEKSRVSHLVTRMTARALVTRGACETDMRGTWVVLAPAGSQALANALPAYVRTVRDGFTARIAADDATRLASVAVDVARDLGNGACSAELDAIAAASSARPAQGVIAEDAVH